MKTIIVAFAILFILLSFLAFLAMCLVAMLRGAARRERALENLRVGHPGYQLTGDEMKEDFYRAERELNSGNNNNKKGTMNV